MLGRQEIEVTILPSTGDRRDAQVRVTGPGDTDYLFPLSITRTQQAVWKISDAALPSAIGELAAGIISVRGTGAAPPASGYSFDSYNAESTINETINKIRNFGHASFLKDRTAGDEIASIFGGGLVHELESINQEFIKSAGTPLIGPLDYAFEPSEASADLGTPPDSKAEFLYRICILSVIIDAFRVRLADEPGGTPSLQALKRWLASRVNPESATKLTATFARVKGLRKQYPIHDHFERDVSGQKVVREEVRRAEDYFEFRDIDDHPTRWKKVIDSFQRAVRDLRDVL